MPTKQALYLIHLNIWPATGEDPWPYDVYTYDVYDANTGDMVLEGDDDFGRPQEALLDAGIFIDHIMNDRIILENNAWNIKPEFLDKLDEYSTVHR